MSTEKTWEQFYKENKGVYSQGHFTDRKDPDGKIANEYQILYREEILTCSGEDKTALELGCGNQPVFEVLGRFKQIWYTDISIEALKNAEGKFKKITTSKEMTSKVHFKEMNVEKIEFDDKSLNVVFNTRAPHRDETSNELFRVLKDGGVYLYQTIGEEDFMDFKKILKGGRFYNDYLQKGTTRFQVVKQSLVEAGFDESNIELIFDKKFKSYFDTKEALKEKLWLLVGDYDFDTPENKAVLDDYCETHQKDGQIYVENHRIIIKAVK